MNPKTKTRSARVWTHLSATLRDRLSSYCAASNITERAVFEAALEQYISGASDMTLVLRRLDRLGRATDRVHRDVELLSATFAVFVRLWFAHTPNLRDEVKPTAREDAESRYRQFMDYVAQEFTGGRRFLDDLPREAMADDAELAALANGSSGTGQVSGRPI
ncbi:MAG: hypothetical protein ABSC94_20210 [Polyangiaceae bacterium]|jgi:hypothetical protein